MRSLLVDENGEIDKGAATEKALDRVDDMKREEAVNFKCLAEGLARERRGEEDKGTIWADHRNVAGRAINFISLNLGLETSVGDHLVCFS